MQIIRYLGVLKICILNLLLQNTVLNKVNIITEMFLNEYQTHWKVKLLTLA